MVEAAGIEPATIFCNTLNYKELFCCHRILGHKRGFFDALYLSFEITTCD